MHRRSRLAIMFGCACTLAGMVVIAFAAPAFAHHPVLSGTTTCSEDTPSQHVILWSIGNSQPNDPMTITSASAVYNGTPYDVVGYDNPVPGGGATSATTTLDGSLTGTVTIVVAGIWPDTHTATRSAIVSLGDPCFVVPTTEPPTTVPPTTAPPTTAPPTTTPPPTVVPTTAPPAPPVTVVPTPCNPATSVTHCQPLAFTGSRILGEALIGGGALLLGYGLLWPTLRRRRTFAGR